MATITGATRNSLRWPDTTVIGHKPTDVAAYFGITDWPRESATFDLGRRALSIIPTPGHEPAHIMVYDPRTQLLLSGDTLYPGRLYVPANWSAVFSESVDRLATFVREHQVSHLLGAHIEMTTTPGQDYAHEASTHPNEHVLELAPEAAYELERVAGRTGDSTQRAVTDDFIVVPVEARLPNPQGRVLQAHLKSAEATERLGRRLERRPVVVGEERGGGECAGLPLQIIIAARLRAVANFVATESGPTQNGGFYLPTVAAPGERTSISSAAKLLRSTQSSRQSRCRRTYASWVRSAATASSRAKRPGSSGSVPQLENIAGFTWTGEVLPQKWVNFYTKVLSRFATSGGLSLTVTASISPADGVSKNRAEETRAALRELGLQDDLKVK